MIGIIDSGMGGLTTLAALVRAECDHEFVYYADVAAAPYGNKKAGVLMQRLKEAADLLVRMGATTVVLGCNTATVTALDYLRATMPCVVDGVAPPVRRAIEAGGSVLVLSTALTGDYIRRVYRQVRVVTMPFLATLVDRCYPDDMRPIQQYLQDKLSIVRAVDNVVLGCTHYVLLKEQIGEIIRAKRTFDANEDLAERLAKSPDKRGVCVQVLASGPLDEARYTKVLERLC